MERQTVVAALATKAEFDAAVAPLATKPEVQAAIAPLATKADLEMRGGALKAIIQQSEQLIGLVQQTQQQLQQLEQRFLAELARCTASIQEEIRTQLNASMEPLADLRRRVIRLETEVFGTVPRNRRKRRSH